MSTPAPLLRLSPRAVIARSIRPMLRHGQSLSLLQGYLMLRLPLTTIDEVVQETERHRSTVWTSIRYLRARGLVRAVDCPNGRTKPIKRYELTEAGENLVKHLKAHG
jgi:DNA-binding PadR family transcriptional regulator